MNDDVMRGLRETMATTPFPSHLEPPGVDPDDDERERQEQKARENRTAMAFALFCSKHNGFQSTSGDQEKLIGWCWKMADRFLTDGERPNAGDWIEAKVKLHGGGPDA